MRRRHRDVTDMNQIINILDTSKIIHVGLCSENVPYIVPMNYGYEFVDNRLVFYLHGSFEGKKIDFINKNPICFIEMECNTVPIEDEIACKNGMAYESLMGTGKIYMVEDVNEKIHGLNVLMKTQTGKEFPIEEKHTKAVSVMRIDISEYTAKYRPVSLKE